MIAKPSSGEPEDAFHVVFVCTGNRARSALAEALYARYARGIHTRVSSCGTTRLGELPALPDALAAASRLDVDLSAHRTRALDEGALADADLVLGFEPFHVALAVVDGRARPESAFLLAELAQLLDPVSGDGDPVTRARHRVAVADARRVRSRPDPAAVVPDPLGRPQDVMFRTAEHIDDLVRRLVRGLFGVPGADEDPADAAPSARRVPE